MMVCLSGCSNIFEKVPPQPEKKEHLAKKIEEKACQNDEERQAGEHQESGEITSVHSGVYTEAYNRMITQGKNEAFAQKYAEIYTAQKTDNKSHVFADQYAYQRVKGKSELFALNFAEKVASGKSPSWSNAYASAINISKRSNFATKVADVYTEQIALGISQAVAQKDAYRIARSLTKGQNQL